VGQNQHSGKCQRSPACCAGTAKSAAFLLQCNGTSLSADCFSQEVSLYGQSLYGGIAVCALMLQQCCTHHDQVASPDGAAAVPVSLQRAAALAAHNRVVQLPPQLQAKHGWVSANPWTWQYMTCLHAGLDSCMPPRRHAELFPAGTATIVVTHGRSAASTLNRKLNKRVRCNPDHPR